MLVEFIVIIMDIVNMMVALCVYAWVDNGMYHTTLFLRSSQLV